MAWIPIGGTVTFIAKFENYSDNSWPYMYHCHALTHEDEGMMGSFVVKSTTGLIENNSLNKDFSLYPNPAKDKLFITYTDPTTVAYYIKIFDAVGRTSKMLPRPAIQNGIDISDLSNGVYYLQLTDEKTKQNITKKFIIE